MADPLTEAHRLAQLRLGAATIAQLHAVWPLLDPADLEGTFRDWMMAASGIVQANRNRSAALAGAYMAAMRTLKTGEQFAPILVNELSQQGLSTSLLVTGPVSIRSNLSQVGADKAAQIAEERSSAAGMRWALNGGRDTIVETVRADPRAQGWERVASGSACDFCESLTGRIFGSEDSGSFEAHDRCGCSAEPVYA